MCPFHPKLPSPEHPTQTSTLHDVLGKAVWVEISLRILPVALIPTGVVKPEPDGEGEEHHDHEVEAQTGGVRRRRGVLRIGAREDFDAEALPKYSLM